MNNVLFVQVTFVKASTNINIAKLPCRWLASQGRPLVRFCNAALCLPFTKTAPGSPDVMLTHTLKVYQMSNHKLPLLLPVML